ncbi:MAG: hypothetical protein PVF66_09215, partial [Candidatus Aminicenantes bacterium]
MNRRVNLCFSIVLVISLLASFSFTQDAFNLRTITAGVCITPENYLEVLGETKAFLARARDLFEKEGFTLEGVRVATNPFPFYTKGLSVKE